MNSNVVCGESSSFPARALPGRGFCELMRAALVAKWDEIKHRTHEISIERCPEPVEQSSITTRNETEARQIEHDRETLREIEGALDRLNTGEYGTCVQCGGGIREARLRLIPEASRCFACQEATESGASDLAGDEARDRGPVMPAVRHDPAYPGRDGE